MCLNLNGCVKGKATFNGAGPGTSPLKRLMLTLTFRGTQFESGKHECVEMLTNIANPGAIMLAE